MSFSKKNLRGFTGFTLIEILVAITVFLIIIGSIFGIFISGIQQQRRALANQIILDQTSYALEYMSRALRMADKELNAPSCLSQNGLNYENFGGGSGIRFINTLGARDCQTFFLENGKIKHWKRSTGETFDLTSVQLEITSLRFNFIGQSQADRLQPRVTIFLEIKQRNVNQPTTKIQTTISQRRLDFQY